MYKHSLLDFLNGLRNSVYNVSMLLSDDGFSYIFGRIVILKVFYLKLKLKKTLCYWKDYIRAAQHLIYLYVTNLYIETFL